MSDAIIKADTVAVATQWRQATDVAGAVREFVLKRTLNIQGKKYPPVEAWQAVANAYGCVASARDVEKVDGGWRAIGEVKRMSDGAVLAVGEGFVGEDEKTWMQRPLFARRAMVQTRAISRACRAAFAFVIPLIDAGLQTTPAEEMEGVVVDAEPVRPPRNQELRAKVESAHRATVPASPPEPPHPAEVVEQIWPKAKASPPRGPAPEDVADEGVVMGFGSGKGKPLSELDEKSLSWYAKVLAENAADPAKARYAMDNQAKLAAIKREQARR
jgi:hypothetical protein